ncbi:interferon lambda receptor 1 [Dasypus novemcinctus]|uniref:interferon lambda receptor 1 n=1 Tax=Dasypus novemcinctus TaxID=9361 RepID=UPI0001954DFB|nr:interferon lambda receptor 1 [Dasypus novemcinctus]
MAEARRWVPLLLCLLQSSPGKPHLAPPQNVTLLSQNFSVYLTWLPGPGNPQNVTYFVAYQSLPNPLRWRRVKRCAGSKELACSLTCLEKQDLFNKFKGRVQAVSPSSRSPWVESEYMDYLSEVEPAPPILIITRREEGLRVNATYQLPRCVPLPNLKYEVYFWREETGNKTLFPATLHGQPVQIPLQPAASGRHCLSARTIYTFIYSKYSKFSSPTCFFLEAPGATWPFSVLPSLLLPLLLVVAIGGIIWKSNLGSPWFQQAKMPRALDFSGHRHPVATFKPSGLESPDDLFLCPQKELTRRVRLSPRVRAPATLPAGSEEDSAEDEEEDTDDSGSFEPYLGPPPCLGPECQILGHSGADRPDSGGLWLPLVQVGDCPAWDASDSSWASSVDSSPWDEAKTPGYVAKKGAGKEVEGDRHWEPLPLPKFPQDSGSLEESPKDDLSSWATWGSTAKGPNLVPGDPPVSLQTLVFCWESSPNEEEEEEEGGGESETEASGAGGGRPVGPQDMEGRNGLLGHYMAR